MNQRIMQNVKLYPLILLLFPLTLTGAFLSGVTRHNQYSPPIRLLSTTSSTISKRSHHGINRTNKSTSTQQHVLILHGMKRPILDQIASTLFNLEMNRVESSSITDEKGRRGEPMEWASETSLANKFSQFVAGNDMGYRFKQWVADIVAGEYNREEIKGFITNFIKQADDDQGERMSKVKMFSFTTCPFCRSAKDYLDQEGISYESIELDLLDGNRGNEVRAMLGEMTKRTSVPSIFINGQAIGGLNDGMPGLMPLAKSGKLRIMLEPTNASLSSEKS